MSLTPTTSNTYTLTSTLYDLNGFSKYLFVNKKNGCYIFKNTSNNKLIAIPEDDKMNIMSTPNISWSTLIGGKSRDKRTKSRKTKRHRKPW
jgi:hypothetical protein